MSDKKHTPGPWVVDDCCPQCVRDDGGMDRIALCHTDRPREEDEANAALIAAAPDMLAELETLRDLLLGYAGHHQAKGDDVKADANMVHVYRIEALIKKASPQ